MSEHDPDVGSEHVEGVCGDAAAYALGALGAPDADAFERHLAECSICRDELAAFEDVVQVLPMSAPQVRAPRGMQRRLMRAIRDAPPPAGARDAGARSRPRATWGSRWVAGATGGLAAIAASVAISLGALGALFGSSAGAVFQAQVTGVSGSAQVRLHSNRGELVVHGMTAPKSGRIYQVWLERGEGSKPVSASVLFGVDSDGDASVGIPGDMHGVSAVLVTSEPLGGTKAPTTNPVVVANLD